MTWRSVGPYNMSGCIRQISLDRNYPRRIYAAADSGGVWQLDYEEGSLPIVGTFLLPSWVPLTDTADSLPTQAVTVAPSNSAVVYRATAAGQLLRAADFGRSFRRVTIRTFGTIRRIIVHPADSNRIYLASSTGLHRGTDGGASWELLDESDVTDAVIDPDASSAASPVTLYVATRGVGVRKATEVGQGGLSWTMLLPWAQADTPSSTMIKVAVGRRGAQANRRVVAKLAEEVFVNGSGGRGRWISRGKVGGDGYPWAGDWCHALAVDPFDDNVILAGAQDLFRTGDAGQTWSRVDAGHADQQGIEFDPRMPGRVFLANDGGVWVSFDGGQRWQDLNAGLVTGELDHAGISGQTVMSDLWHHGIAVAPDVSTGSWRGIEGGSWEGADVYGDPKRFGRFYVFHSKLGLRTFVSGTFPLLGEISVGSFIPEWADFPPRSLAVDMRPSSDTLLAGTVDGRVMRLLDASRTADWRTEPGVSLNSDAIVGLEYENDRSGAAYAVSASGLVFHKGDVNGPSPWERRGQWADGNVRALAVNPLHPERVYLINATSFGLSTDGGRNWTTSSPRSLNRLPPGVDLRAVVAHPADGRTVFVGLENGVFSTVDDGRNWSRTDVGLPNGQLRQIFQGGGQLYAATYGRGLWRRPL